MTSSGSQALQEQRCGVSRLLLVFNIAVPFVVIVSLWVPVLFVFKDVHYLNPFRSVAIIPELPDDQVLELLKAVNSGTPIPAGIGNSMETVAVAEKLLLGRIDMNGLSTIPASLADRLEFRTPFDARLVARGDSSWQLPYSGFLVPKIFLQAYDASGRDEFLVAARDFILGWWDFEKRTFLPTGFLWNDHAIASRAMVLAEFWVRYRNHKSYRPLAARFVVGFAKNLARLLSRKALYTYKTNHGTMQNIGLAKLSILFAGTGRMDSYRELAFERIMEQMSFFFGAEGVVLEHSPHYHVFGIELLDDIMSLMKASGGPIPPKLLKTREAAVSFLKNVTRPNGSLARIGDTHQQSALESYPDLVASWRDEALRYGKRKINTTVIFEKAKYATHRVRSSISLLEPENVANSHLTAFWDYLPYMGHKHADDLGVHLWANGVDWWTAVGYWPYPRSDRGKAICWNGSNAPHLIDEPCGKSKRKARALGSGQNEIGFMLDLLREGPDGFKVRRQILSLTKGVWLTLDYFDDQQRRPARLVWLSDPMNNVEISKDGIHRIESKISPDALAVQYLSSSTVPVKYVYGDAKSTLGWVMAKKVRPAPTFIVELPSKDSWSLNVSVLEPQKRSRFASPAKMVKWDGPEAWKIKVPLREGSLIIERDGREIVVQDAISAVPITLNVKKISVATQIDHVAVQSFKKAEARYGARFEPYTKYRLRLTWGLMSLLVLHFGYLLCLYRFGKRFKLPGLIAPTFCWSTLSVWIFAVYLVK